MNAQFQPFRDLPAADRDLALLLLALESGALSPSDLSWCLGAMEGRPPGSLAGVLLESGRISRPLLEELEGRLREAQRLADAASMSGPGPAGPGGPPAPGSCPPPATPNATVLEWTPAQASTREPADEGGAPAAPPGPDTVDTGAVPQGPQEREARLRPCPADRYRFLGEIGRGGLGRVLEAVDLDLGRPVAVKMMLPGAPGRGAERFLREALAAGRLPHPNIVAVHEVGVLAAPGGVAPYFTMTRIVGRDLSAILGDLLSGVEETRARFSRHRLLRVFQEVCNAVSYAHDHGVVHRDLKPANVMVGEYGEVYVVDWGLAKVKGKGDEAGTTVAAPGSGAGIEGREALAGSAPGPTPHASTTPPALTLEGDVVGTPAYMSPEQAEGRVSEVDERTDIYSLGAMLYEILTLHPPFEGEDPREVISRVKTGKVERPSTKATRVLSAAAGRGPSAPSIEQVPPELDEIVLRAMSREKSRRFGSARELSDEIQEFLEGVKERERNHRLAVEKTEEGRSHLAGLEQKKAQRASIAARLRVEEASVPFHWPAEKKKPLWALMDRVRSLEREEAAAFSDAAGCFLEAVGFERANGEARSALAELYWGRFLEAEAAGDEAQRIFFERLVRRYNDGQMDERLKGDGSLAVSTRRYACACLLDGRWVEPAEFERGGAAPEEAAQRQESGWGARPSVDEHLGAASLYHPVSGRALAADRAEDGLRALEPRERVRLRVHGPECRAEPMQGARVWLLRLEERDRIHVPVFPEGVGVKGEGSRVRDEEREDPRQQPRSSSTHPSTLPAPVLDRLYDSNSPFRPGEGLYLGRTPVPRFRIPMGSYLLIVAGPDETAPVRVPVFIARNADEAVDVHLYGKSEIPPGFVQVPGGRFPFQGDPENPNTLKATRPCLEDFFASVFPVTCREYGEFLDELHGTDPAQAERRVPREADASGPYWGFGPDGRIRLPRPSPGAEPPGGAESFPRRLAQAAADWAPDWPVLSISWLDAIAFCDWKSRREGRLFTLPLDVQWEKCARGVDGRPYPWGWYIDDCFCNSNRSVEGGAQPMPVGSFPIDESVHGVRGLGGNSRDWCLDAPLEAHKGWRFYRGGCWPLTGILNFRGSRRNAYQANRVYYGTGARLVMIPRLGKGPAAP